MMQEITYKGPNPPHYVYSREHTTIVIFYECGDWMLTDTNFAPAHCLDCGADITEFHERIAEKQKRTLK